MWGLLLRPETFYVAYLHFVFFHVLIASNLFFSQESKEPVRVPTRKAGLWHFSTVSVAGFKEPLQIAALPGVSGEKRKQQPYLVLYCQRGSERTLNAFVDWREEVSFIGQATLKINGTEAAPFDPMPLVPGSLDRMKLPGKTSSLLREAIQVELSIHNRQALFVLLHWDKIQRQMQQSCATN